MTARERIQGRKVGVIGMARSGMAAAVLANRLGASVFVSDVQPAPQLDTQLARLNEHRIRFETGGHTERLLQSDYLIISPGVPPSIPVVKQAVQTGIPIFSEVEFAYWVCRGTVLAVTGSNGKTTTTSLIGEILKAAGKPTFVCGNIGRPFAEVVEDIPENGIAVLEISTFQLERIETFAPHIALILNLTPDHLDRHGTFEAYKKLKYRIAENQDPDDYLILNRQDKDSMTDEIDTRARRLTFSIEDTDDTATLVSDGKLYLREGQKVVPVLGVDEIGIPGPHNLQNASAAVAAASLLGVSPEVMADALRRFPGVEHRLERVDRVAGIEFINDSKATNVDSVTYALRSIDKPIWLIAGGKGKGASYTPIAEFGRDKIKGLVLIGQARQEIFDELGKAFPTEFAESLQEAVRVAFDKAEAGDAILLSPACASFDMFESYEQRGHVFKKAVASLRTREANETT
jgi:UDP-N-acetylmuramoylalanine--D-glutamate ligase